MSIEKLEAQQQAASEIKTGDYVTWNQKQLGPYRDLAAKYPGLLQIAQVHKDFLVTLRHVSSGDKVKRDGLIISLFAYRVTREVFLNSVKEASRRAQKSK